MSRIRVLSALFLVSAILGVDRPAGAQIARPARPYSSRSYSYQPARSTLSPYLQLSRRDGGQILPSFQTFVQPQIQAQQFRRQQESNTQVLQQDLQQVQQAQQQQPGGSIATGIGSGFRNSQQYYRTSVPFFLTHRPRR